MEHNNFVVGGSWFEVFIFEIYHGSIEWVAGGLVVSVKVAIHLFIVIHIVKNQTNKQKTPNKQTPQQTIKQNKIK